LLEWYDKHRDYPYPSKEEKAQLAVASGKSFKQVSEWFTNRRARQKLRKFLNDDLAFGTIYSQIPPLQQMILILQDTSPPAYSRLQRSVS